MGRKADDDGVVWLREVDLRLGAYGRDGPCASSAVSDCLMDADLNIVTRRRHWCKVEPDRRRIALEPHGKSQQ